MVLFGATASGKTSLAGGLFSSDPDIPLPPGTRGLFRGRSEIVSADSMQVYRGLDIGTAKPDSRFLSFLPHHLIDIADPLDQFGAGTFVSLADEACADIYQRGKIPVLLGGTAFYLKNFIYGLPETPAADRRVRSALQEELKSRGLPALVEELRRCDGESARRIHEHDEYRILRALEVYRATGRPLSSYALPSVPREKYRFLLIALLRDREELYRRIEERVDQMFAAGLAEEFRSLADSGLTADAPGLQAIGYREFFLTDPPGADLELIRQRIVQDTKLYAKRQEVFFKALNGVALIPAEDAASVESAMERFLAT